MGEQLAAGPLQVPQGVEVRALPQLVRERSGQPRRIVMRVERLVGERRQARRVAVAVAAGR